MPKKSKALATAAPLPAPNTGDKAFDAAAAVLQKDILYATKPHVKKAFTRILAEKAGDDKRMLSLLVPEAFDFGPDEGADHMTRERYFRWITFQIAKTAIGCEALIDALIDPTTAWSAKTEIADNLAAPEAEPAAAALAARFPPKRWNELVELDFVEPLLPRIVEHLAREGGEKAFTELAKLAKNDVYRAGVLAGVDHASRDKGYGRFNDEANQQPVDERWIPIALASLTAKDEKAVAAAVEILADVPPRAEWKPAIVKAQKYLDRKAEESCVAELLEAIDALGASPAKPTKSTKGKPADQPLPPLKRRKAPAPARPKLPAIAKLSAQIDEMLAAAELTAKRDLLVQPAFHVLTKRVADGAILLGGTKVGGLPDLPAGTPWPERAGVAMSFIAQFDLAKLEKSALPTKGLLLVFVDDEPFGEHYLKAASVMYFAKPGKLVRTSPPPTLQAKRNGEPERVPYATCAVTLVPTLTLPSPSNPATKALSKAELARYQEHVELPQHHLGQLLGFREHGYDASNPITAQFLFRITSDDQADMSFGDEDPVDFYVPMKGLAKADFRKAYPYCGD